MKRWIPWGPVPVGFESWDNYLDHQDWIKQATVADYEQRFRIVPLGRWHSDGPVWELWEFRRDGTGLRLSGDSCGLQRERIDWRESGERTIVVRLISSWYEDDAKFGEPEIVWTPPEELLFQYEFRIGWLNMIEQPLMEFALEAPGP